MIAYPPLQGEGDRGAQRRGGGGVPPAVRPETALARRLRRQLTYPEVMLWQRLRRDALGCRFRKQHPIGPCVVDFCALSRRLVVDVDGAFHDSPAAQARDAERDKFLNDNGYRVLRVTAAQLQFETEAVLTAIAALVASPLHQPAAGPPPRSGEER